MTVTTARLVRAIAIIAAVLFAISLLMYAWMSAPGGGSLTISG